MKPFKRIIPVVLALLFSLSSAVGAEGIVSEKTPYAARLKWEISLGSGYREPCGQPTVVGDCLAVVVGKELLYIGCEDGTVVKRGALSAKQSMGYTPPTYADGKIFVSLSSGVVNALDAQTLESLWAYRAPLGGQGLTRITYCENLLYTGFWNAEDEAANFVCLDAETGEALWTKEIQGGLYWAGALCRGNAVIFGTDDGVLNESGTAHIYSLNRLTGEVISDVELEGMGDIRSSAVYYSGRVYFTSKGGFAISANLEENGVLSDVFVGDIGKASTSTPVIYKDVIYIGAADKTIKALDAHSLEVLYSVPVRGYPQGTMLISTARENEGYIYIYATYNTEEGGVTLIKTAPDARSAGERHVTELFEPSHAQFCISSVISDSKGNLYYKNDSGYLFALEQKARIEIDVGEGKAEVKSCLEAETACTIFAAGYENGIMTGVFQTRALLPEGEASLDIDVSKLNGDVKIIITDDKLRPIE